ncbi:MAG: DegT/DnrJ/EryC1/StrS family aminotransferase [Candidatus Thermoplasmatota archaeon]|nr:DegT/DnrJ/EryC1/StrS family aminotransferase [Candidatus Thermoplasmatota archaeon]
MIPIAKPLIGDEEKKAVLDVLDSGMLAQGEKVKEFEEKFAEYIGVKHAVATSNGTTALHLALLASGVKSGDEVITTPFTFISTATSILFCGAKPVFADINPGTFNIDPEKIEKMITGKTKAILPVHLYGQSCEMDRIMEIAEKHALVVVEDACQSHGAEYHHKKVGGIGDAGCFSFYPTKNMITGEGGMVTTNDEGLAEKIRTLRNHGQKERYNYAMVGYNFRMTDIAAAIGIEQLKKLDGFNDRRRGNAGFLSEQLNDVVETPYVLPDVKHVFHQYTIKTDKRELLKENLKKEGIGFGIYYPEPLHFYEPLKRYGNDDLKNAENLCKNVLSLPVHPGLSEEDLEKIVQLIKSV